MAKTFDNSGWHYGDGVKTRDRYALIPHNSLPLSLQQAVADVCYRMTDAAKNDGELAMADHFVEVLQGLLFQMGRAEPKAYHVSHLRHAVEGALSRHPKPYQERVFNHLFIPCEALSDHE